MTQRESRESKHWLTLISKVSLIKDYLFEKEIDWQLKEAEEIMLILSSIINNIKK